MASSFRLRVRHWWREILAQKYKLLFAPFILLIVTIVKSDSANTRRGSAPPRRTT